jgi:hypothetical protein
MQVQNQPPLHHSNRYSAESACAHCEGVIRHESWCATQSATVSYAFLAVLDPNQLSLGDELILHGLGVIWTTEKLQAKRWRPREDRSAASHK